MTVLPSLDRLTFKPAPAPTGVARAYTLNSQRPGRRDHKEVVWFADRAMLDDATCEAGGYCGFEAVFNLFPWIPQGANQHPFAAQLLRSDFATQHVRSALGNSDYGIDSNDVIAFSQKLYADFLGAHTSLTTDEAMIARWLDVAKHAEVLVQPFFDPGMWASTGHEVPSDHDGWKGLISARLAAVESLVSTAHNAELSVDFVINNGVHFQVLRMRDLHPNFPAYFEWDVIDAWDINRQNRTKQAAFDRRVALSTQAVVRELAAVLEMANPQPIAMVIRPRIWQTRGMQRWLQQWEECRKLGTQLQQLLQS